MSDKDVRVDTLPSGVEGDASHEDKAPATAEPARRTQDLPVVAPAEVSDSGRIRFGAGFRVKPRK